ncbi:hypothetical protein [Paenibacillus filicis]
MEVEEISNFDLENITDWLNMAAGVEQVRIITERYDSSIYFCGSALAYSDEKSKLWSELCAELVTFNFIWGSLESLILKLVARKNKTSTTYLGREFLTANYKEPSIEGYLETYSILYKTLGKELSGKVLKNIENEHYAAKGLYLVSKLRNQFAHGSRLLPIPDDWSDGLIKEVDMIRMSSRIVLLTIQMLLISQYGSNRYIIEDPVLFDFDELEEPVSLDALIKNLHLQDYDVRISMK